MFRNITVRTNMALRGMSVLLAILAALLAVAVPCSAADPGYESKAEKFVERAEKFATEKVEKDIGSEVEIELQGIVIDRTKTPVGRRFYREFAADWLEGLDEVTVSVNLLLEERPARGSGSLLTIRDEQGVLFSQFLSPRIIGIQKDAEQAAVVVRQRVLDNAIAKLNESRPGGDLLGEGY
jgi:curli production assembly/transport component CsgE